MSSPSEKGPARTGPFSLETVDTPLYADSIEMGENDSSNLSGRHAAASGESL